MNINPCQRLQDRQNLTTVFPRLGKPAIPRGQILHRPPAALQSRAISLLSEPVRRDAPQDKQGPPRHDPPLDGQGVRRIHLQ